MKPIDFGAAAASELETIQRYYDGISGNLGSRFRSELERMLAIIEAHPQLFARDSGHNRRAILRRFPYSIVYRDLTDRIWVAAVVHHRRKRRTWLRRKPS